MYEEVVLVDENDIEVGTQEKLEAHKKGVLHRAFSIFIFNARGELLLHRRAQSKYHCGGLWTNTCCSHPRPGEEVLDAAHRKLQQEMGFDCELESLHAFTYKASFPNGLTEHEYDHVLGGMWEGEPHINPEEADDWKWISISDLRADMATNPTDYTYWFTEALDTTIAIWHARNNSV
jgi:isopentenyl-diphosphate Delta-isomerase